MMQKRSVLKKICILAGWLLLWQACSLLVSNSVLLAGPLDTLRALLSDLRSLSFWRTVGTSMSRIFLGIAVGTVAGLMLAAASYRWRLLEEALRPLMGAAKSVPVASFIVILLIWLGSARLAASVSFLIVLPNIYENTLQGLLSQDQKLLEMARVFEMPLWNRVWYLYRPALDPFLLSGLKVAVGMGWKAGVAAELIGVPDGSVGEQLYLAKISLNTAEVFAWTAVVVAASKVTELVVLWVWKKFCLLQPPCRKPKDKRDRRSQQETSQPVPAPQKMPQPGGAQQETLQPGATLQKRTQPGAASKETSSSGSAEGVSQIQLVDVSKSYGDESVYSHLYACYSQGERFFFHTPSGSGKTTLFRLIAGLEEPDEGTVHRSGRISMLFQEDRLCEGIDAVKNVALVTGNESYARRELSKLLEEESLYKPCGQLSGGQKRRVALVRAMAASSDFCILDEPFTGLDEETRRQVMQYIDEAQGQRGLLVATHTAGENWKTAPGKMA